MELEYLTPVFGSLSVVSTYVAVRGHRRANRADERAVRADERAHRQVRRPVITWRQLEPVRGSPFIVELMGDRHLDHIWVYAEGSSPDLDIMHWSGGIFPHTRAGVGGLLKVVQSLEGLPPSKRHGVGISPQHVLTSTHVGGGQPMSLRVRLLNNTAGNMPEHGRALFRCVCKVPDEDEPYEIYVDTGRVETPWRWT